MNRIDEKYFDVKDTDNSSAYRLETYRSRGNVSSDFNTQLRCYFIQKCEFEVPNPDPSVTDIHKLASKRFLERATQSTKEIYQKVLDRVCSHFFLHGTYLL
eukprot:Pompholyxophrys_punicea_v1_NODE_998_length_1054_cov_3.602344.p1 type:complete len:101 gc:universal NODE_998_length_1054_cov_3.602344:383-81(-)